MQIKGSSVFTVIGVALATMVYPTISAQLPGTNTVYSIVSISKRGEGIAADFTWKNGSQIVSFSEHTRGKVVLLNFWATWCGPCRREMPDLVALSKEYSGKNVVVVGVALDQADNALTQIQNFVDKFSIPFVTVFDGQQKVAEAYGRIPSIPTTFIIDKNGKIIQKIVGMQSKVQFETAIKRVL
ncbi:MAG: TlpA family protein disulfide reductase [Ignavibacteria bacterium]|nr:TlpA family protein disulfide reductase [Ignavibacteria bacterium]